jgi:hypothetical protein
LTFIPCLVRDREDGELRVITLGHPVLEAFVGARTRVNTWLAIASGRIVGYN